MIFLDRQPLTFELKQKLLDSFKDINFDIINFVLYFGAWNTGTQGTGLLVFEDIKQKICYSSYAYTNLEFDYEDNFWYEETTIENAYEMINKMNIILEEIQNLKNYFKQ